jgi:hypothetical protein
MRGHQRELEFTSMRPGEPLVAYCTVCRKKFTSIPEPNEKTDNAVLKLRNEFAEHECHPDWSGTFPISI